MDICKLKPDHNTCCSCIDTKIDTGGKVDCDSCPECSWVRILSLGRTIFGRDYAYITGPSTDWKIQKVDIKRIGVYTYVKDEDGDDNLIWLDKHYKEKAEGSK